MNDPVTFRRYVALGDSFTEGVGDADPARPHGVRGWADRVAGVLGAADPEFRYANFAIRGRKLAGVIDEQLEPALALEPDLITIYAGANNVMRPSVDLDALMSDYDEALGRLADSGARVLVWTAFDPGHSAVFGTLRNRFALYNEMVREIADRRGLDLLDYWRMREYRDWRYWSEDRLHMGSPGHLHMAIAVLDRLGVAHDLAEPVLPDEPALGRFERMRDDAVWTWGEAIPWIQRRLTGRSSGDGLAPRYAEPTHVD